MSELIRNDKYREWLGSIKQRVQASQLKAAVAVNRELLELYWFLGEQIVEKQQTAQWGDGFLKQMSQDLLAEFPEIRGFSQRNLKYMRQWVQFWSPAVGIGPQAMAQLKSGRGVVANREKGPQLVAQLESLPSSQIQLIPWGHNRVIMDKLDDPADALFYVQKTIEQIEAELGGFDE